MSQVTSQPNHQETGAAPGPPQAAAPGSKPGLHRKLRRHRLGIMGLAMAAFIFLIAAVGPLIYRRDPNAQDLSARLIPPFSTVAGELRLLGTDNLGRDMLARTMAGGRTSMGVALASLGLGATIGIAVGLVAGLYGGWVDNLLMRLVDAQLSMPTLILAMLIAALLGPGVWNTILTLGLATWPIYARIVRGEVLAVRENDFIEAAVAMGASDFRLVVRHILPSLVSTLTVVLTLETGRMVISESSLGYVGLGVQPPDASWGSMIKEGQTYIFNTWWMSTVPGLFILLTVLGINLTGDWLRDLLDPRIRQNG